MAQDEIRENENVRHLAYSQNIPLLYSNGIVVNQTLGDISLNITINGQSSHVLNISRDTAKSLCDNLKAAIDDFEGKTNTKILGLKEISSLMRKK